MQVIANHPGALAALLQVVAPAQIVFGSDYPFRTEAEVIGGLGTRKFAPRDRLAIERENALRLMPSLKARS